jgi:predicted RNase H-like HicB family nuclease
LNAARSRRINSVVWRSKLRVKKYLIMVEETETGYSAYSPDAPGCGSTGKTKEEIERNIQEALEFHLEGLREEGYEIPEPSSYSSYINVAA